MMPIREVIYQKDFQSTRYCLLAGDIGGTNSNFGIFELRGTVPTLLISLHVKSQEVTDYATLTAQLLRFCKDTYGIVLRQACFGAAGIITSAREHAKPTNLSVAIDARAIIEKTELETLVLINDFEAVGLGIDYINQKDLISIIRGGPKLHAQKACIGAGTGMGKAALLWNNHFKRYLPITSEGGHADCAAQNPLESKLFEFIQADTDSLNCPVSWEAVLSGSGIQRMYRFLGTQKQYQYTGISQDIIEHGFKPDLISSYAQKDEQCLDTFNLYATFYARCAKNFVLDVLALNGIYIAGGIAAKNIGLFRKPEFINEFTRCGRHSKILELVPVTIVADYNVSLYGAAAFLQLNQEGVL